MAMITVEDINRVAVEMLQSPHDFTNVEEWLARREIADGAVETVITAGRDEIHRLILDGHPVDSALLEVLGTVFQIAWDAAVQYGGRS